MPAGIFIDSRDTVYVADSYNQRVQVFRYLKSTDETSESLSVKSLNSAKKPHAIN
jgi:hypothetical protein